MSTFLYNAARYNFATGAWNWTSTTVNAALVTAGYSPLPTDTDMTAVPSSAIVTRDIALTGLAVSAAGVCSGNIPQIDELAGGFPVVGLLLYALGGSDAESPLIYYSSDGVGFPFLPENFNWDVLFDGANGGWFQV